MSATIHLTGPSSTPGAPKVSTAAINTAVNAALLTNLAAAVSPRLCNTGIIIPYYFYTNNPYTDPAFQGLITLCRRYHSVPVIVVLNQPGFDGLGGPGPMDGNIAAAIRLLKATGVTVLGYVHTSYGARAAADVQADVALWSTLYSPTVDGIFYDEMPYDVGVNDVNLTLYAGYYSYAHDRGFAPVVGNPGSDEAPAWYATKTADIIIINEVDTWPSVALVAGAFAGGHGDYDYRINAILVYGQATFDLAKFQSMQPYVQWVYITDQTLPNPWGALPPYMDELFAACALPANGEYVSATIAAGSAVALTTATPANVTSIPLTAGTWDVAGTVGFTPAGTTSITALLGGVSDTTAVLPSATSGARFAQYQAAVVPGAVNPSFATGTTRLVLAVDADVYLVTQATFTVSTMGAYGFLGARRVPS